MAQEPSRAEVQRRINSLYDRAESDTGNFNATRAMASGRRPRVKPAPGGGRERMDPAVDNVVKTWFDVARAKLGPTVPAVLPPELRPDRLPEARPTRPTSRPDATRTDRGREPVGRDLPELTAGRAPEATPAPVAELTAGSAAEPATGPMAALPAGPVSELTAVPAAGLTAGPVAALPAAPETGDKSPAALPAPAGTARQSSLKAAKSENQRKLTAARELLSRHVAQWSTPLAAIELPPADDVWRATAQQARQAAELEAGWQRQDPAGLGTLMSSGAAMSPGAGTSPGTAWSAGADTAPGTAWSAGADTAPGTAWSAGADSSLGAGLAVGAAPAVGAVPAAGTVPVAGIVPTVAAAPALGATPAFGAGGAPVTDNGGKAAKAVEFARAQIGKPCVWGATGPESYDCSGLTQAAWKTAGVRLPRTARDQAYAGTVIALPDVQPGDLVFFTDSAGHVGICVGNGMMVHAPSQGPLVREDSILYAGESAIHSVVRPV